MSHLNTETLARLVDERPAPLEAAHLSGCDACRAQLDAMRADVHALGQLGDVEPPAHAWDDLADRLHAEGLMRGERRVTPALFRIAAALVLFLAGTAAGFTWRDATLAGHAGVATAETGSDTPAAVATAEPAPATGSTDAPEPVDGTEAPRPETHDELPDTDAQTGAPARDSRLARDAADDRAQRGEPRITGPLPSDARFAAGFRASNEQEAATLLRNVEGMYLAALAQYAQHSSDMRTTDNPVARLVALESIVLSTREALDHAPADPIINGYHMTAVAERDVLLHQLAAQASTNDPWF